MLFFGGGGGGTWSPDGRSIVFSSGEPFRLYEVPAGGGTPSLLFEPEDSEESLSFLLPHFLPLPGEERALLFTRGLGQDSEVAVRNLDTQSQETLAEGTNAAYSPTGHLVYQRRSALWAMPFSLKTLKPTGQAFQTSSANGYNPSVARDGTLVYLEHTGGGQIWLAWRDRTGKKLREVGQPQPNMAQVSLSPDGTTAAVSGEDFGWDVWLQDIGRNIKTRLTFDPALTEGVPVWSPRGDRIAFLSGTPDTSYDIMVKAADGSGESEVLVATDQEELPTDWSLDGRYFIFERTQSYVSESSSAPGDLWYLDFEGEGSGYQEFPFMKTAFDESLGKLSPDSRFIAYCSDESGRREIYVQPFPKGGAKSRISRNGGTQPRWSRDGKELFYVEDDTLIAVAVKTTPSFSVGSSTRLFKDASLKWNFLGHVYDVSSDGRQFVLRERLETSTLVIRVVQNWFEEFRDRQSEAQ